MQVMQCCWMFCNCRWYSFFLFKHTIIRRMSLGRKSIINNRRQQPYRQLFRFSNYRTIFYKQSVKNPMSKKLTEIWLGYSKIRKVLLLLFLSLMESFSSWKQITLDLSHCTDGIVSLSTSWNILCCEKWCICTNKTVVRLYIVHTKKT